MKYRIVRDNYAGYEVQVWRWWFPFYIQCGDVDGICNTHMSLESAKEFIKKRRSKKVVWKEGDKTC